MLPTVLFLLLPLLAVSPSAASPPPPPPKDVEFSEVCYEGIGCFNTGGNFFDWTKRPISREPMSPQEINPTYTVYSRKQRSGKRIVYNRASSVTSSGFDPSKKTHVLTHGYTQDGDTHWLIDLRNALLSREDSNVIVLSWGGGSGGLYSQATANTRVVGALLAQLIQWLERNFNANRSRFHLIGHSLGAHTFGYTGERLRGLGRITGMDPAGPFFENTHPEVRLDPTDAEFVDVIHSDGGYIINAIILEGGLGLMQPLGHVDFYPNGGKKQPNCEGEFPEISIDGILGGIIVKVTCDHGRSHQLMISSVLGGNLPGYPCNSYDDFKAGKCSSCGSTGCAKMGYDADKWNPKGKTNVKMFMRTSGEMPYETSYYTVSVKMSDNVEKQYGDVSVTLIDSNGKQTSALQVAESQDLESGKEVTAVVSSEVPLDTIVSVKVDWVHRWTFWWSTQYLTIRHVSVSGGIVPSASRSLFCADDYRLKSEDSVTVKRKDDVC